MPDGRRRSREGWSDTMESVPDGLPAHVHRLPPVVRVAVAGLVVAVFLLLVAVGFLTVYVYQANQYVQGRGEYRDAEAERMDARAEERVRRAICDLLDQLPDGGLLDRPRAKYHCGPGIPIEELTPEEQAQLNRPPAAVTPPGLPPNVELVPDDFAGGAIEAPDAEPYYPTPGVPEPPPTAPIPDGFPPPDDPNEYGPLVDLGPVTDPLCDLLTLCIGPANP